MWLTPQQRPTTPGKPGTAGANPGADEKTVDDDIPTLDLGTSGAGDGGEPADLDEGTVAGVEGEGLVFMGVSSPTLVTSFPPRRLASHREYSAGRRPSTTGTRSTSTSSTGTDYSRGRRRLEATKDLYLANPAIPSWHHTHDDLDYEPWPLETDSRVKTLLGQVTEPPRYGMFERVDSRDVLQNHMKDSAPGVQALWERLLECYDVAMGGKRAALLGLVDAHQKIRDEQEHSATLTGRIIWLTKDNNTLSNRVVPLLEAETAEQQKQIATLKETNRTLARDVAILKTRYRKLWTAQETQFEVLEGMIAEWGTLSGTTTVRSTAGHSGDYDARFEPIRAALEEAALAAAMSSTRYQRLKEKYDALVTQRPKSQGTASNAELESKLTRVELRNRVLENELKATQRLAAKKDEDHAQLTARLTPRSEPEPHQQQQQTEIDQLKKEAAVYKDKCAALQRAVDGLKQKFAAQAAEVTHDQNGNKTNMEEIEDSMKGLHATVTGVIGGLESGGPGAESSSSNIREPLLSEEVIRDIRDIEATQLRTIQSSQAVMDEIKASIDQVVKQITAEMANTKAIHAEEAKQILEELRKLTISADDWIWDHQTMDEHEGLIQDELDALRRQVQSNQGGSQEIGQQVREQYAQIDAAKVTPQRSGRPEISSAGPSGQHADAACFCTLLRHLLPGVYHSIISGG
ncbi:hypothetical protein C8A00DRAFT_34963, partial [Chaetomidium leptoderma]